ncbi:MAG: SdiA-regulated domain-containing protein [Leeuwenhoekiella sp.]
MKKPLNFKFNPAIILCALVLFAFSEKPFTSEVKKTDNYELVNIWKMPDELEEISGLSWISKNKVAAVQDEDGILFIYDLDKEEITAEIEFADDGDYEGVAIHGKDAYVMRSDGRLFEILDFEKDDSLVNTFESLLSDDDDVESLTLDKKKNRLLMTPKDRDGDHKKYKGVYAFDLNTRKMLAEPIARIGMSFKEFEDFAKDKMYDNLRPSDIAVHPQSGNLFVLEGVRPKLVEFDQMGKPMNIYIFDKDDLWQPEGLTFSPDGRLFICNEADDDEGTIVEVRLN